LSPDKKSFRLFSTKYLVSTQTFGNVWPARFTMKELKVFENPKPPAPAWAAFSLHPFLSQKELLEYLDSAAFDPNREIVHLGLGQAQNSLEVPLKLLLYERPEAG